MNFRIKTIRKGALILTPLFLALILLLYACGGSKTGKAGGSASIGSGTLGEADSGETFDASRSTGLPELRLASEIDGDQLFVRLEGISLADFYQIGGVLEFDRALLEFQVMTPDGVWGEPSERIEFARDTGGKVEFALSKRYIGAGISGNARLAEFRFRILDPSGDLGVRFAASPLVRDSKKHDLVVGVGSDAS